MASKNSAITNQNVYDDESFFTAYSKLPRSQGGLANAPEWPILKKMMDPQLSGNKVLDLGCGYGWFCRYARDAGASHVDGVDISERMLKKARELDDKDGESISYDQKDLEVVDLEKGVYQVVFSSLTLHYVKDLERLLSQIHQSLQPGGQFVFSAEHPIFTSPKAKTCKFQEHESETVGDKYWPLDGYAEEGPRAKVWIGQEVIKVHRTIGTYFRLLTEAGFLVTSIVEWMPTKEMVVEHPDWQPERERPMFLLIQCRKNE
jgi:SAM-dependent methyltransferase